MRRRDFITLLGGAIGGWSIRVHAQQSRMPAIGFLNFASPEAYSDRVRAFQRGLAELGYVEGLNLAVEYRWAHDHLELLPVLASDLVHRNVAVIVAGGTQTALAAKQATSIIPIVFQTVSDPVQAGLVESLNRPGGNLTGVATLGQEIGSKQLNLLHELLPQAKTVALLTDPTFPNTKLVSQEVQLSATARRLDLRIVQATTEHDLDVVFDTLHKMNIDALVITTTGLFTSQHVKLAALSLRYHIPAIYQFREFAVAGGLMSYGASFTDSFRLIGGYAGRILKGEKPADLPVQEAVKLDLILNIKTAKELGLIVPERLLALADEVIE